MEQMTLRESKMTDPLLKWLDDKGYIGYCEVPKPCWGLATDMVGEKDGHFIAIEMKIGLTQGVIHQATVNQSYAHLSYCATRSKPMKPGLEQCKKLGLGILRVHEDGTIEELLGPRLGKYFGQSWIPSSPWKTFKVSMMKAGGVAGVPCMAGKGPAQLLTKEIEQYITANPTATWSDIYNNVPNHYAHAQSMRGAMYWRIDERLAELINGNKKKR